MLLSIAMSQGWYGVSLEYLVAIWFEHQGLDWWTCYPMAVIQPSEFLKAALNHDPHVKRCYPSTSLLPVNKEQLCTTDAHG